MTWERIIVDNLGFHVCIMHIYMRQYSSHNTSNTGPNSRDVICIMLIGCINK